MMELRSELAPHFQGQAGFDQILALEGETFRQLEGRRTFRWVFGDRSYFIKIHLGVGWREIFKNLVSLRWPVLGADNEYHAIKKFEQLNIPTMTIAGFGRRGSNPARRESFLITDELLNVISLEDHCRDWPAKMNSVRQKRAIIAEVARIARTLHDGGVNHRDFYLCHFLGKQDSLQSAAEGGAPVLHVIDLHRVQIRERVPRRWLVKDLGGLLFSALDIGLTSRDYCRFLKVYLGAEWKTQLVSESRFWRDVIKRAQRIYLRDFKRSPDFPTSWGAVD